MYRLLILHILLAICTTLAGQPIASSYLTTDGNFTYFPAENYPITADALPYYTTQIKYTLPENSTNPYEYVQIEYPETVPLSNKEVTILHKSGFTVPDSPTLELTYGISRKSGVIDVILCPIFQKDGNYFRLISCKLAVNHQTYQPLTFNSKTGKSNRWTTSSVLATGHWVKIGVSKEGIYSLTAAQLKSMGFQDISRVRLYGYGGRIQPESWTFSGKDRIPDDLNEVPVYRRNNDILFFAEGTIRWSWDNLRQVWAHENQPYSRYSYYFLTESEKEEPATLIRLKAQQPSSRQISTIKAHAVIDDDAMSFYSGGREMYESYDFSYGNSRTYRLEAPNAINPQTAKLSMSIAASNPASSTAVELSLNNTHVGQFYITSYGSDEIARERRATYNTTAFSESNSILIRTSQRVPAHLNYIRATYDKTLNASEVGVSFTPNIAGSATLNIADATNSTELWQIGTADIPTCVIETELINSTLQAHVDDATQRFVIVDTNKQYPAPTIFNEIDNQNLHADPIADMVIIIPASNKLFDNASRLAEYHRNRGLSVNIVRADQLYNEFSSGTPDASAYRRYLKMLYDRASTPAEAPRYLLLFGNSAWDNRMLSSEWKDHNPDDYLLAFEVSNNFRDASVTDLSIGDLASYITDDFFGWLDDSEGANYNTNKLDIAIGRFTCTTRNEASILVDKTIEYLENKKAGPWQNKIYFLADDLNNTTHMRSAENTISYLNNATNSRFLVNKIYWDAYKRTYTATGYTYPEVSKQLRNHLEEGALIFNYTGHGSPEQISHANILQKKDFNISSNGKLPLWILASCKISPFDTEGDDIGRLAMANPTGGAIAVMCATRAVFTNYNEELNNNYCRTLFGKDSDGRYTSIGEALRLAKVSLVESGRDVTNNKLKYILLGDPSIVLNIPRATITIDSINGEKLSSGSNLQLTAGSIARFSGYISNGQGEIDQDFEGTVSGTFADRLETITCQNNARQDLTMTYKDRPKIIFEGNDSVKAGRFTLSFVVPRDISYTNDAGRATFHAVNASHTAMAQGDTQSFHFNGTDANAIPDTIPPKIYIYLDSPDFPNGGITSSSPIFFAQVSDDTGISATGIETGHDMELILDNNNAAAISLNNKFTYNFGDYRSGTIVYQMENLEKGPHQLTFRVWDVNNNVSTSSLMFHVGTQATNRIDINATANPAYYTTSFVTIVPETMESESDILIEVFDTAGHKVWTSTTRLTGRQDVTPWNLTSSDGAPLPAGLYFYRVKASDKKSSGESTTKKIIIIRK